MTTIETNGLVTNDGKLIIEIPPDVSPGKHRVVVMIDPQSAWIEENQELGFPVIHVDSWPENISLSREEWYDD